MITEQIRSTTKDHGLRRWWKRYVDRFQENRASERRSSSIPVEIWWNADRGGQVICRGVCVDISADGMGIVYPGPESHAEHVHVKLDSERTTQCAQIRHCQRVGTGYLIGLKRMVRCGQW